MSCSPLICCGGNGRSVKAMLTKVNFPETIYLNFVYLFFFFFALNFVYSVDILSHYHERTQRVFTGSTAPCRVISFVGTQGALYPIFMFHAP